METIIENGKTSAIVVHEDSKTIQNIWNKVVDLKVKSNQLFIKGYPVLCVVGSVFVPEAAPVLLGLAAFFATKTGKDFLSFAMKTEEITGDVWRGDVSEAVNKVEEGLDNMLEDEVNVNQVAKDITAINRGK